MSEKLKLKINVDDIDTKIDQMEAFRKIDLEMYLLFSSLSEEKRETTKRIMIQILKNAFTSNNEKHRELLLSNKTLTEKIFSNEHSKNLLKLVGFELKSDRFLLSIESKTKFRDIGGFAFHNLSQVNLEEFSTKKKEIVKIIERNLKVFTLKEFYAIRTEQKINEEKEIVEGTEKNDLNILKNSYLNSVKKNEELYPKKFTVKSNNPKIQNNKFQKCILYLELPTGLVAEVSFHPNEKLKALYYFNNEKIFTKNFTESHSIKITTTNGIQLAKDKTFTELNLVPVSKLRVIYQNNKKLTDKNTLKTDLKSSKQKVGGLKSDPLELNREAIFSKEFLNSLNSLKIEKCLEIPKENEENIEKDKNNAKSNKIDRLVDKFFM